MASIGFICVKITARWVGRAESTFYFAEANYNMVVSSQPRRASHQREVPHWQRKLDDSVQCCSSTDCPSSGHIQTCLLAK